LPEPRRFLIPLFLSLNTVAVCVPSGISYFTLPSNVGTSIFPPSVAFANEIGISHHTSFPSLSNNSCSLTFKYTYKSPAGHHVLRDFLLLLVELLNLNLLLQVYL